MVVPFDHEPGETSQSEGFTRYRRWDFEAIRPGEYPLLLYFPYYLLYSSQVKQASRPRLCAVSVRRPVYA
jgi:alpha,alpha-trehalose phosphorylase